MRTTYKIKTWILGILAMVVLTYSCAKADEEFVHRTNTISQMLSDDFQFEPAFDNLYTEITGTILIWLDENGIQ